MAEQGDEKSLSIPELRKLEEELVDPLPLSPQTRQQVRTANAAIWVADELSRLIIAFLLGAAVLVLLAIFVSPWLWLAVAVWFAAAVATLISSRRRRAAAAVRARQIDPPR